MSKRQLIMLAAALLTLAPSYAAAQNPPVTLWSFLGVPRQPIRKLNGMLVNRHGNLPQHELKPPLLAIADPRNLLSKNPAIKKAAEIKAEEDLKKQKIKALKYLGTIGCPCYPGVTEALIAALDDCTEDVRVQAAKAIEASATKSHKERKAERKQARKDRRQQRHSGQPDSSECESCQMCGQCGGKGCCREDLTKRLAEIVYDKDENGCWVESSAKVRSAALSALCACHPNMQFGPYFPPSESEQSPEPAPKNEEADETPDTIPSGETPDDKPDGETPSRDPLNSAKYINRSGEPAADRSAARPTDSADFEPVPASDLVPVLEVNELHVVPIHGPAAPVLPPKPAQPDPLPFPTVQAPLPQSSPAETGTTRSAAMKQIAAATSVMLGDQAQPDPGPAPTVLDLVNDWRHGARPLARLESRNNLAAAPAGIVQTPVVRSPLPAPAVTAAVPMITVREVYPVPQAAPQLRQPTSEPMLARSSREPARSTRPSSASRHTTRYYDEPTITIVEPESPRPSSSPRMAARDGVGVHSSAALSSNQAPTSTSAAPSGLRWRPPTIR